MRYARLVAFGYALCHPERDGGSSQILTDARTNLSDRCVRPRSSVQTLRSSSAARRKLPYSSIPNSTAPLCANIDSTALNRFHMAMRFTAVVALLLGASSVLAADDNSEKFPVALNPD